MDYSFTILGNTKNAAYAAPKETIMKTAPRLSSPSDPPSSLSRVAGLGCLTLLGLQGIAFLLAVLTPLALLGLL